VLSGDRTGIWAPQLGGMECGRYGFESNAIVVGIATLERLLRSGDSVTSLYFKIWSLGSGNYSSGYVCRCL